LRAIRLVVDRRVPTCVVRGEYSIATLDEWLLTGEGDRRGLSETKIGVIADLIYRTGKVPGSFTVGTHQGKRYLLDGRHRREAARRSGRETVQAVINWVTCELG
jgi:hypothetical protein